MFSIYKNSYLQLKCCTVDPKVINRAVDAARGNQCLDVYDINPPYNRLTSEQPTILIENVDVTRRPLAFGRLAIPKLIRELHTKCIEKFYCAVNSLMDVLHDPEKLYEALRYNIVYRLADLLTDEDPAIRERICLILTTIAGYYDGRVQITKCKLLMENLMGKLIIDEEPMVRLKAACVLEMMARMWIIADDLLEENILQILMERLDDEPKIVEVHLQTIKHCLYGEGQKIAIELGILDIMLKKLDDPNLSLHPEIISGISGNIGMLLINNDGKDVAFEYKLLCKLNVLLHGEDVEIQKEAALAIMSATILTRAKWQALRVPNLAQRLLVLAHNYHEPGLQMYTIKALTNLIEHPQFKKHFLDNYLEDCQNIIVNKNPDVQKYKNNLLTVLQWKP